MWLVTSGTEKERLWNAFGTVKSLKMNQNSVSVPEFQDKYN